MNQGVGVAGIYVRDQDEALDFYVEKLGFRVHTDARNGDYRWLTVQHPDQPSVQLGLFKPQPPTIDEATAQTLNEIVAKGAMPPLTLVVEDCRAAHERFRARGVEFTQEPIERFGNIDANFRDPSGNGWKMIETRRGPHARQIFQIASGARVNFKGSPNDLEHVDSTGSPLAGASVHDHRRRYLHFTRRGAAAGPIGLLCAATATLPAHVQRLVHALPALRRELAAEEAGTVSYS